jgi:hypothetical protein
MPDLLHKLLPQIERNGQEKWGKFAGDAIFPAYDGLSLLNLPTSVCHWLDAPALGGSPALAPEILDAVGQSYQHVILLLADGLGLNLFQDILQDAPAWRPWQERGTLAALTSISPSTTSAALTTLWTGLPTCGHGVTGYQTWLKEYGMVANMIDHSPAAFHGDSGSLQRAGFDPQCFLPGVTLGTHLSAHDVRVSAFQPRAIAASGLSMMHMKDVDIYPYRVQSDLWITLSALLQQQSASRTYTYVYWDSIDYLSHRFGPRDERLRLELHSFVRMLADFLAGLQAHGRGDTLFLMAADHGHVASTPDPHLSIYSHPELMEMLVMNPSGDGRLPYLYQRPGCEDALRQYFETHWPGRFRLFPSHEVLASGLLGSGPVYSPVADRIGDWVAFPQGENYLWTRTKQNDMLGRHGGLHRDEMLVPLFALPL